MPFDSNMLVGFVVARMVSFMGVSVSKKGVEGPNKTVQDGHGKVGVDRPEFRLVTKNIKDGNDVSPEAQGNDGEDDGGIDSELVVLVVARSEERRVGKECRSRWSPH